ncbi:MAG: hypothetical protein IPN76_21635 [Saprospiraceae bacterium]|jgi:hypothetical protein|nr:hypothetical protein [Saprospiraceae bacterium]
MNLLRFSRPFLAILLCGFLSTAFAQTGTKNYPFSWKETTDNWYKVKTYTFKYADNLTAKGTSKTKQNRGPVCTNNCLDSTSPDACTEDIINENLKDVELPGFKLPSGYSGVEYVTFDVQTSGKVNGYQVVKQSVACKPCIQKAVNLVAELGEWHPAVQDGIFAKSTVVVPVYFK